MNATEIIKDILSDAAPEVFKENLQDMFQTWVINAEDPSKEERADKVFTFNSMNKLLDNIRQYCTKKE